MERDMTDGGDSRRPFVVFWGGFGVGVCASMLSFIEGDIAG